MVGPGLLARLRTRRHVTETISPEQAVARVPRRATIGLPLGPGQPPGFLRALGERDDWEELRVAGALLAVGTDLFSHPGVHYLSGFFGPFERALRESGANISFAPADFRRFAPLAGGRPADASWPPPRRRRTPTAGAASRCTPAGRSTSCSRAGADPDRTARRRGLRTLPAHLRRCRRTTATRCTSTRSTCSSGAMTARCALPDVAARAGPLAPSPSTRRPTSRTAPPCRPASAPSRRPSPPRSRTATAAATAFTRRCSPTGSCTCTRRARSPTPARASSTASRSRRSRWAREPLYRWLHENHDVAFLPVDVVNAPEVIGRNENMVTINGALAVDIHGQVVADTIDGEQFSGIGGAEDFVSGPGLSLVPALAVVPALDIPGRRRDRARGSCRGSTPAR